MLYVSDSLHYYRSYRLRSILLNQLLIEKEIHFEKAVIVVAEKLDKSLLWKTFADDMSPELIFLIETGLASIDKEKGVVSITEAGISALQNGIIEDAANSAFRNFINVRLQILAMIISAILLLVNISALFFR